MQRKKLEELDAKMKLEEAKREQERKLAAEKAAIEEHERKKLLDKER